MPTNGFQITDMPQPVRAPSDLGLFDPLGVAKSFGTYATLQGDVAKQNDQSAAASAEAQFQGTAAKQKSRLLEQTRPYVEGGAGAPIGADGRPLPGSAILDAQNLQKSAALSGMGAQAQIGIMQEAHTPQRLNQMTNDFQTVNAKGAALDDRIAAANKFMADYGRYAQLPSYKPSLDAMGKIAEELNRQKLQEQKNVGMKETAGVRAGGRVAAAQATSDSREREAGVTAKSRETVAKIAADAKTALASESKVTTVKGKAKRSGSELADAVKAAAGGDQTAQAGKFKAGETYTDAKGNRAEYQPDGTWKELPPAK